MKIGITPLNEIVRRVMDLDKSINIYKSGEQNDYPERTERFRLSSVTAVMCSRKMIQFIIGKGFGSKETNKLVIGGQMLIDIGEDIARNIADERGVFIVVKWNGNFEIDSFRVLPFKKFRIGKKDDNGYSGKIAFYNDWCGKVAKDNITWYDVYNPDKDFITSQVKKAGGWKKYKGQVFYYNMDRQFVYPLSRIDSVDLECDNERLASVYKNRSLRNGFFGKTVIFTRPLIDKTLRLMDRAKATAIQLGLLKQQTTEKEQFIERLQEFVGVDQFGGAAHFEVDFGGDDLEKAVYIKNIESNIDADMFKGSEDSAERKIMKAYNGCPKVLIDSSDNALFSGSGEMMKQASKVFQDNVLIEQSVVERILNELLPRCKDAIKAGVKEITIQKLIVEPETKQNADTTDEQTENKPV